MAYEQPIVAIMRHVNGCLCAMISCLVAANEVLFVCMRLVGDGLLCCCMAADVGYFCLLLGV